MTRRIFLPSLQGRFGDWLYYIALMSLDELKARVSYARELQNNVRLSDFIQRRLDDAKRKGEIAEFLLENSDRFFNSVVVGVHGGDPQWHPLDVQVRTAAHKLEDIKEADREVVGYLELVGTERLFALDGQHRLAGIREALNREPRIGKDQISVIFVSHKDTALGKRRTRNLFIMLNKRAVPVKRPDIIALDEVDLSAIIARRLVDDHPWFARGQIDVERHTNSLPKGDREHLTTLGNLYDLIRVAVPSIMDPDRHEELTHAKRIRLPEARIDYYLTRAIGFFERLAEIDPLLSECFTSKKRELVLEKARDTVAPHILFRPIGMMLFTRVLAKLRGGLSLSDAFKQIALAPILMNKQPFVGIIWNESKGNIVIKGQSLSERLLLHMLGYLEDTSALRGAYAEWFDMALKDVKLPRKLVSQPIESAPSARIADTE
jgi:DNA sulfur modification protein DndB